MLNKIYIQFSHSVHFLWRRFRISYCLDFQGPIPNLCFSSLSGTWIDLFYMPGFCSSFGCGKAEEHTSVLPPFPAASIKENVFIFFKHQIYSYQQLYSKLQKSPPDEGIHMFLCDWVRGINPKPYTPHLVSSTPFCLTLFSPHRFSDTQRLKEKKKRLIAKLKCFFFPETSL